MRIVFPERCRLPRQRVSTEFAARVFCGLDSLVAQIARRDHLDGIRTAGLDQLGGKGFGQAQTKGASGGILTDGIEGQHSQDSLLG